MCSRARTLEGVKVLSAMDDFDFDAFGDYLLEKGLHEDVVATIINNRICPETFLDLTESDLKELAPTIGDRIRLRNILEETRKVRQLYVIHWSWQYALESRW